MRTIIYARFSTDRQSEASIADQLRVCRAYAASQGWTVAAEYSDQGISGAALGNRPGAQRALAELGTGDVLLLMDLERLARSQDLAPLITRLRHRGARVIGVQDHFDSESRTARLQAGISGIMSEEYRAMIAARTRSALEMRAKDGKRTGGKAYDDTKIVREIFERFAAGETLKAIASDLNRRGVPSPGAHWKRRSNPRGRWVVSALHSMLQNERYIGRVIWNRSQWIRDPDTGRRHRRERPRSEWIVTECEPIIDRDTWARVQARFAMRSTGPGGKRRYLLSGILECALCGSKLIVTGGSQHRYVCSSFKNGGPHACRNSATVPRAVAEEMILAHIKDQMLSDEAIDKGVELLREARREAERPAEPYDREVAELERLVREGLISAEVAAPALAEARRRAKANRGVRQLPWPSERAWRAAVESMREILQGEDVELARETLRRLLGTIRCEPQGDHVLARMSPEKQVLLTGTGRSVDGVVAGACSVLYLPVSTRRS